MAKPITYLALLRGINVGGKNIIKMLELKACFEKMGFSEIQTYIQSGNIFFQSPEKSIEKLISKIEKALSKTFNYHGRIVLISAKQLQNIIKQTPPNFGTQPEKYRYDVMFLKAPLTSKEALPQLSLNPKVDQAFAAKSEPALYFQRLISKITSSRINKIIQLPLYQDITIRNWNSTSKLAKMLEEK
jgi:uncharacterized protein (DUF1697 family)